MLFASHGIKGAASRPDDFSTLTRLEAERVRILNQLTGLRCGWSFALKSAFEPANAGHVDEEFSMTSGREPFPTMGPSRILVCAVKDNAGLYMTMVEFSSFEEATENSKDLRGRFTSRSGLNSGLGVR